LIVLDDRIGEIIRIRKSEVRIFGSPEKSLEFALGVARDGEYRSGVLLADGETDATMEESSRPEENLIDSIFVGVFALDRRDVCEIDGASSGKRYRRIEIL
jgi:hypothetical protein